MHGATMKNILFKVQKGFTQWDPISFTVEYKILYKEIPNVYWTVHHCNT